MKSFSIKPTSNESLCLCNSKEGFCAEPGLDEPKEAPQQLLTEFPCFCFRSTCGILLPAVLVSQVYICRHLRTHTREHECTYVYNTSVYIYIYVLIHICMCVCVYIYIYVHMYMCICAYVYIHIHKHMSRWRNEDSTKRVKHRKWFRARGQVPAPAPELTERDLCQRRGIRGSSVGCCSVLLVAMAKKPLYLV